MSETRKERHIREASAGVSSTFGALLGVWMTTWTGWKLAAITFSVVGAIYFVWLLVLTKPEDFPNA